jgi:hypothetical protein
LSREGALAAFELVDSLARVGVTVVSAQESWTEAGSTEPPELLLAITAWVARTESQRRSERSKAGIERAPAQGKTDRASARSGHAERPSKTGVLWRDLALCRVAPVSMSRRAPFWTQVTSAMEARLETAAWHRDEVGTLSSSSLG